MSNSNDGTRPQDIDSKGPSDDAKRLQDFPDLAVFTKRTEYPALRIPVKRTADLRRQLKNHLLRIPKTKNVYDDPTDPKQYRILVLSGQDASNEAPVLALLDSDSSIQRTTYTLEVTYDSLSVEDVLKCILEGKVEEVPTAFEIVGHIAHVNLREDCLPYKFWIGKVLLDKNAPRIKTVVNKLGSIDTKFRTFGMEVIAGSEEKDFSVVTVKEEKCSFQLDFRQVYWNSRLAGEHKRLVTQLFADAKKQQSQGGMVVADVMAGVGPFAVPLTAHHNPNNLRVYANDLNPSSFHFLKINSKKNQCQQLLCFNEDGRAFVHRLQKEEIDPAHYIMNLPASAPEFLDAFRGYRLQQKEGSLYPWIHVHCFAPKTAEKEDFYQCAVDRCSTALGCALDREQDNVSIRVVRDVSPNKNMLCVSFRLPKAASALERVKLEDAATDTRQAEEETADESERETKRAKKNS